MLIDFQFHYGWPVETALTLIVDPRLVLAIAIAIAALVYNPIFLIAPNPSKKKKKRWPSSRKRCAPSCAARTTTRSSGRTPRSSSARTRPRRSWCRHTTHWASMVTLDLHAKCIFAVKHAFPH